MRIARAGALPSITPEVSWSKASSFAQGWVFEPLVRVDSSGALAPCLADTFQRLDQSRYRFHLRPAATFSDGTPVTIGDVADSLSLHRLQVTPGEDSFTVESRDKTIPTDVLLIRALVFARRGERVVGTGPFALRSQAQNSARLERLHPAPHLIQDIVIESYPTPREAFAHTLRGDADLLVDVQPRDVEFFENVPRLQIVRGAPTHVAAAVLNLRLPREERRAVGAALTGSTLSHVSYNDQCKPLREGRPQPLPAGALLDVLTTAGDERIALAVRRAFGARGGRVQVVDPLELLRRIQGGNFDVAIARPLSWPQSSLVLSWRTGSPEGILGYSNPRVDAALDAGDWPAAQAALEDDPPAVFLCSLSRIAVVDARIKHPELGPYDILESLPKWETE